MVHKILIIDGIDQLDPTGESKLKTKVHDCILCSLQCFNRHSSMTYTAALFKASPDISKTNDIKDLYNLITHTCKNNDSQKKCILIL